MTENRKEAVEKAIALLNKELSKANYRDLDCILGESNAGRIVIGNILSGSPSRHSSVSDWDSNRRTPFNEISFIDLFKVEGEDNDQE